MPLSICVWSCVDALSSQTKCNTAIGCCDGNQIPTALARRPLPHCRPSSPRALDPANRGRFGSRAIDHRSRDQAQHGPQGRLQTRLRRRADQGAPLERLQARKKPKPRAGRPRPPRPRLVARAGRRKARPPTGEPHRQPRDHLPLHLRPDRTHQGLQLAPLPAARQEQARMARRARWQLRILHRRPNPARTAPRGGPAIGKRRGIGKPTS